MAARSSGPSEARVPCPQCGGLIHPIAGRCKHCKADVAALRSARPAAATALPALARGLGGDAPDNARQAPAPPSAPVRSIHLQEGSQPVLPPRPTGQMPSAAPRSIWRNWPVLVIALALIAIGIAVVLMVWPAPSSPKTQAGSLAPPPAPERMDTDPLPPGSPPSQPPPATQPPPPAQGADPWANPGGGGRAGQIDPPADPDDDIDPSDVLQDPFGSRGRGWTGGLNINDFAFTVFTHACNRIARCGNGNAQLATYCTGLAQMRPRSPPSCNAAQRCLDQIDQLDCSTAFNSIADLLRLSQSPDCDAAMHC